jgi:hypothetical protein
VDRVGRDPFRPKGPSGECNRPYPDRGWSGNEVGEAQLIDDDIVRSWFKQYREGGIDGLQRFQGGGSAGHLTEAQEVILKNLGIEHCSEER